MAELDLKIVHTPGMDNVVADVLSRYGQHNEGTETAVARHGMSDAAVYAAVKTWLHVVAGHLDLEACCKAAAEGLAAGFPLASFPCSKCGATCASLGEAGRKLLTTHVCPVCKHRMVKSPPVLANPLAVLGCQLHNGALYIAHVPATSETL